MRTLWQDVAFTVTKVAPFVGATFSKFPLLWTRVGGLAAFRIFLVRRYGREFPPARSSLRWGRLLAGELHLSPLKL